MFAREISEFWGWANKARAPCERNHLSPSWLCEFRLSCVVGVKRCFQILSPSVVTNLPTAKPHTRLIKTSVCEHELPKPQSACWQIRPHTVPLAAGPQQSPSSALRFPFLSPGYRRSSIRMCLTGWRRTAWAHYDKHTRMLLTQCLDSLWQANSFNPGGDSNPSPADKSVNKAINAEQEPLV